MPPSPDLRHLVHARTADELDALLRTGLTHLHGRLAAATRPHTGIDPADVAARVAAVDLDRPLADPADALAELDAVWLDDAVWFHEPGYAAHLNCPVVAPAVLAELLTATVNPSIDTVDQSMGATFIEQRLIGWTAGLLGFDADRADGVFTPGGTTSNLQGLHLARDHARESTGAPLERLRVLASADAHMSVDRAARLLGLAPDAVLSVPVDARRRMDPIALARSLEAILAAGLVPAAVVATAGTTDHGAIDPIDAIAAVLDEHGATHPDAHRPWLHVDAAYGGGLLLSARHRGRLAGVERADSATVDFHKTFFQPVACSAIVVRQADHLRHVAWHADYLNPADGGGTGVRPADQVAKTLQTTRRFDPLKLWLTLRLIGAETLGSYVDALVELARAAHAELVDDPRIELRATPELSTLLLRPRPADDSPTAAEAVDALVPLVRRDLAREGRAIVASTRVDGRRWLKLTLLNPMAGLDDVRAIVEEIAAAADRRTRAGQTAGARA